MLENFLQNELIHATVLNWVVLEAMKYITVTYCTISINSAGPVTRDGHAEILVSATSQTCRDMSKFSDIFGSFAPQATIFFMMGTKYFQHQAKITVMGVTIRRPKEGA